MKKKIDFTKALYWFVLASFIVPVIYLVLKISFWMHDDDVKSRADYVLMLIQCLLGAVVIHIPSLLSRKLKIDIPPVLFIMYLLFLYGAIFLGEVRSFYYSIKHWDDILHFCSSMMTGMFAYMLVVILNKNSRVAVNLSPIFISLFAFTFSIAIGALWEIYEFSFDGLLGLNMQKFRLEDGTDLIGHEALRDTMKDIVVDCCGAFVSTVIGFLSIIHRKGWTYSYLTKDDGVPQSQSPETAEITHSAE